MGIMERHARAKHAAEYVPGYALDRYVQKRNLSGAVTRYGKRGELSHVGPRERAPMAILRALARMARGTFTEGLHA